MSASSNLAQAGASIRETNAMTMEESETGAGNQPNCNVRRRHSQDLEKARRQKKQDESRHVPQFTDGTTPNTRTTRRAEKHTRY